LGKFVDLTGMEFGRLKVLERAEDYISPSGERRPRWLCQCNCKGENSLKIVNGNNLKSGLTKSCGCLKRETTYKLFKKYNIYDLTGEYGVGWTSNTNEEFYFDLENYDLIKNYSWYKNENGYIRTHLEGNYFLLMHRLVMNCPEDMEIDHKFHNKYDNRKEFLRFATKNQNGMNKDTPEDNTSGVKGVYWDIRNEKWKPYISINGKQTFLGAFDDFEEAVIVRKEAEEEYYGEYNYKNIKSSEKAIELNP